MKKPMSVLTYGQDNSFSTAGIRLEFKTDSRLLKTAVCTAESNPHERSFYSFDIYSDGKAYYRDSYLHPNDKGFLIYLLHRHAFRK